MGGCNSLPEGDREEGGFLTEEWPADHPEDHEYAEEDFVHDKTVLATGHENYRRKIQYFGYGDMGIDVTTLGIEEDPALHEHECFTEDWNQVCAFTTDCEHRI
eukprot:SAG31_NODE_310_length_17887_cov_4.623060_16_plen_103_part_00